VNKLQVLMVASIAALAAACSSAPTKTAAPAPAAKAAPAAAAGLTGMWKLTTTSEMGAQDADMTVTQTGDKLAGKIASQMGTVDFTGSVTGDAVKFGFTIEAQGNSIPLEYTGKVAGNSMKGDAVFGSFGSGTFTATKK
jgi:hypothetical protein